MLPRRSQDRRHGAGVADIFPWICLVASFTTPVFASEPREIAWRGDYSTALREAISGDRLLWIQFTGPWCPNCTRMEQDSYPHEAIRRQASESFVPLKLRSDENEDLALGFNLSGLPATVIVDPSREVLAVHQGYLGPDDLSVLLGKAIERQDAKREAMLRTAGASAAGAKTSERAKAGTSTSTRPRTKTESQLALSGYCPVSLISDKRLVAGQVEYTVTHEGRLYRLANLLTFNLFRGDPQRFVPANNGCCPVSQLDQGKERPGDPRYGVLFQGRLYLCATRSERQRFLDQPSRYAAVDVAERGFCPHCLAQDGALVRGDPRYDLKRDGRRYWFPDPSHRDAFLSALASGAGASRR